MITPDVIYLIDIGDEIAWCAHPNPTGEFQDGDSVKYVKAGIHAQLLEALEELTKVFNAMLGADSYGDKMVARMDLDIAMQKATAAIAAAKGQ